MANITISLAFIRKQVGQAQKNYHKIVLKQINFSSLSKQLSTSDHDTQLLPDRIDSAGSDATLTPIDCREGNLYGKNSMGGPGRMYQLRTLHIDVSWRLSLQ